ncbi:hypothetical protein D3C72_1348020 [compost metagenome]
MQFAVGGNGAADVIQVLPGIGGNCIARDATTEVVDIFRIQLDDRASGNRAAIGQIAFEIQIDFLAGQ